MKIIKEFENKLLKRKELTVELESEGSTLSRKEAKEMIAKKLKVKEDLVIVNKITSHFGSSFVTLEAYIYLDEKALKEITSEHLIKRNTIEEAKEASEEA